MKKIIAIFLSLVMVLSAVTVVFPSISAAEPGRTEIPVIYLEGTGETIYRKTETGEVETIFPLQIPDNYVNEKIEAFLPVFAKAFFTQQWDEFCDVLCEILSPILSKMRLDKNGEASDGSYIGWSWSRDTLPDMKRNGTYGIYDYYFRYDWRLSPLATADRLHQYIEDVMYVTGAKEVAILGRCYGSNVVAAYMEKYDGEHIKEVIHYASAMKSASFCSKVFAGELYLEADSIERFLYDIEFGLDDEIMSLIRAFVTTFNKTYGLDIACWAVNNVYKDIYLDIVPRVLVESYATFPSYWSMVADEDYEKAKKTIYHGSDVSEYAGLIEKTDDYYNNVQLKFEETLKRHESRGIQISNIVKYGKQELPITAQGDKLSDYTVTVEDASFGATATNVDETFSDKYIEKAIENSTAKYISPDKQIDASTCLIPDNTWFIKNLHHSIFPNSVNNLVSEIVNDDNFTIESSDMYPQYLCYDESTDAISPMTAENMNTADAWNTTFFEAFKTFFESLFKIIKNAINANE